jgi:hypothetical protein
MAVEQSSVEFIYEKFNTLSSEEFKQWMKDKYYEIVKLHKMEIMGAYESGQEDYSEYFVNTASLDFYNEFYGESI